MRYLLLIMLGILPLACSKKESKKTESWTKDSLAFAKVRNYINDPANCTTISWMDAMYKELDTVKEGKQVEVSWRFKNTGNKPLIVANVTTSCDCTVVDKPKKAIATGGQGIIKAKFNTKDLQGWQRKDVYVLVNNKTNLVQTLSFAVNVIK
ncbi:DUF1573 domain-containing protein [Flavobacterium sp. ZB4P13]|uniref:DUF1573 domain-containing protein n=1 Tax=Flavobacterium sp. ZB4P13 TaxID=3401728 RepID=UPI003AAB01D5